MKWSKNSSVSLVSVFGNALVDFDLRKVALRVKTVAHQGWSGANRRPAAA